ncbi:type II secretion system F family protein [Candidatus Woesearchaeota archaeon]|nr:type II secretion system F family protein [Candidatus Woesearchaeota archaeon]
MKNVQILVRKALDLVSEVETYLFYKENLQRSLKLLFDAYQRGHYDYFGFEREQKRLLKGRSEEEWLEYYDSYILSLLKRIEKYNSQIFYEAYQNEDYKYIGEKRPVRPVVPVRRPVPAPAPPKAISARKEPVTAVKQGMAAEKAKKEVAVAEKVVKAKPEAKPVAKPEAPPKDLFAVPAEDEEAAVREAEEAVTRIAEGKPAALVKVKPSILDNISIFFRKLFAKKEVAEQLEEIHARELPAAKKEKAAKREKDAEKDKEAKEKAVKKQAVKPKSWFERLFTPKQTGFGFKGPEEMPEEKKAAKKERPAEAEERAKPGAKPKKGGVTLGGGIFDSFKMFMERSRKVDFSDEQQGKVELSTLHLETSRRKVAPEIKTQIEKITATALTKEAKRIKSIMGKKKALKIYQPSFFGALANMTIKRISLFLLDAFPDFFKDLYHSLRLANIKILSNTYVNMMVLGVISSFFAGLFFMGLFFAATPLPVMQMISRTLMMALLISLVTFAGFYAYPSSKVKQRRRSINSNLPFAINHMSAVSSSGVSPTKMFKLISQSKEYGDISVEIEKIVNYIEIFGYDLLTAIKAIAATTPSYQFKDFLEGMISTTQTGGDMKTYLTQKADEAMLNYKLERQKYSETISTYSDIYTGILIAAPLFFVAALSLVSLLGGTVGGMDVNIIIVLGTYVVIPIMNVSFLTFLEVTQPEI